MKRTLLTCALLISGLALAAGAADTKPDDKRTGDKNTAAAATAPAAATNAQFEKMKSLVGTWLMADKDGKPTDQVFSVIRLTAGGSALHETIMPGQEMEMISVYTVDNGDLVMTHYCMLGNQPRMKADPKSAEGTITFDFAGGGNLDVKKDKHMHGATLTFVDADHLSIDGVAWDNGAPSKEMCHGMKLVRKK